MDKYDFEKAEKEMQMLWDEYDVYRFDIGNPGEIYSIDTPPPTISGSLHIGHIFSYTQAEMIARFKRMQGYNVFYPFGFDDNGLPTERLVEKKEGIIASILPRSEFVKKCLETTKKYENEFKELWKSLGFSVDWSLQYETINERAQRISQKSFVRLYREGKAYMKDSPVLWCTECKTSIAQAELEVGEKETLFHYITFPVDNERLIVATTRPELLYGCVCLFVNPVDERYGKYIGKTARVPLYDYEIPILSDEKVGIDKGTGVVMCSTFGDATDAEWYEKHKLPYKKVIGADGFIDYFIPHIGGLKVKEAREEIVRLLSEKGMLLKSEPIIHAVSFHGRCGTDIEILPSKQWYIDILSHKDEFIQAADRMNWYPEYMKNRYVQWVENLKWDWCISRQRYFGVPIPVWYCKECGNAIVADEDMLPVNPMEMHPLKKCTCGSDDLIPETSVLDTWATSSVTPFINARWLEGDELSRLLPMSMRTQAHEIIRTWAFYTIVKSIYHTGDIPWRDIMVCGFVLAKKGEKISKSKNNAELSPTNLVEAYSADAVRYWAANTRLGTDTFFDKDELNVSKRFLTKLWNASRFSIMHLKDFEHDEEVELMPVDKWIVERCKQCILEATRELERYEVGLARHTVDEFFWKDFCDYYLEIVKDRLYKPEIHGFQMRKAAQKAVYFCMLNILKIYAVFVPHITEYIYQSFFRQYKKVVSLHLLRWEKEMNLDESILQFGEELKDNVYRVRKYKTENALSMKAEIEEMIIVTKFVQLFNCTIGDLLACCNARKIIVVEKA